MLGNTVSFCMVYAHAADTPLCIRSVSLRRFATARPFRRWCWSQCRTRSQSVLAGPFFRNRRCTNQRLGETSREGLLFGLPLRPHRSFRGTVINEPARGGHQHDSGALAICHGFSRRAACMLVGTLPGSRFASASERTHGSSVGPLAYTTAQSESISFRGLGEVSTWSEVAL